MPDEYGLITYEEAVQQAEANPDEVEKSWLLHEVKNSPAIKQLLMEMVFQKLISLEDGNSPVAIIRALDRLADR